MEKNDVFVCEVLNYGSNGEGVSKIGDGKVAFVPYSLKGERVSVKVAKVKKDFIHCEVRNVLTESSYRTLPKCVYFGKCGGCQLQHVKYEESLKIKQQIVQSAINKIAKLNINVLPVMASNLYYGYRNKISLPFDYKTRELSMHDLNNNLLQINDCVIVQSWCKPLIEITNKFVKEFNISVYNPITNKGILKQLIARKIGNSLLVSVVINGRKLNSFEDYFASLLTCFDSVGLSININMNNREYLPTSNYKHLCGIRNIELNEFGVRYSINNACFLQVNSYIKQLIYEQVVDECKNFDLAIDCYSGAGLLTAIVSKNVKNTIGVEIVKDAVVQANKLCLNNNILNVKNICADSAKEIINLKKEIEKNNTVVVLDPPRKGCDKLLLNALNKSMPQKIIYVSCDPATLARDLYILTQGENAKFNVNFIRPYDMFPQTKHVETVAVLSVKY